MAKDLMEDGSYFGTMMVYKGHATEWFLEQPMTRNINFQALQFIKTKTQFCGFFDLFLCLEDRVSVLGLCNKSKSYRTTALPFPLLTLVWPLG
jgi:phosphate acetyltransferase